MYSKSAIPQLIRTMATMPSLLKLFISENFRCPYQAMVINELDNARRIIVEMPFMINDFRRRKNKPNLLIPVHQITEINNNPEQEEFVNQMVNSDRLSEQNSSVIGFRW